MKKTLAILIMSSVLFAGSTTAFASTTTDQLIAQLQQQLTALTAQLVALTEAQNTVATTQKDINSTLGLLGNLSEGMSGEQVKLLQSTLAGDKSIYPEGKVTGYYGKLTKEAVKRFQKKHGLRIDGKLDMATAKTINKVFEDLRRGNRKDDRRSLPCVSEVVSGGTSSSWSRGDDDDYDEDDDEDDSDSDDREDRESRNEYRTSQPCRIEGSATNTPVTTTPSVNAASTTPTPAAAVVTFTLAQLAAHNSAASCYTAISGSAYNLTSYVNAHPGGGIILAICGKDGTASFDAQHGGRAIPANILATLKIGTMVP